MEVIALIGSASCGKTNTLGITYQMLLTKGFKQVPGHFSQEDAFNFLGEKIYGNKDFRDILTLDGKLLGIATGEDSVNGLSDVLHYFKNAGCAIAVCSSKDEPENIEIIKKYSPHILIKKHSEPTNSLKRIHDWEYANKVMSHL